MPRLAFVSRGFSWPLFNAEKNVAASALGRPLSLCLSLELSATQLPTVVPQCQCLIQPLPISTPLHRPPGPETRKVYVLLSERDRGTSFRVPGDQVGLEGNAGVEATRPKTARLPKPLSQALPTLEEKKS